MLAYHARCLTTLPHHTHGRVRASGQGRVHGQRCKLMLKSSLCVLVCTPRGGARKVQRRPNDSGCQLHARLHPAPEAWPGLGAVPCRAGCSACAALHVRCLQPARRGCRRWTWRDGTRTMRPTHCCTGAAAHACVHAPRPCLSALQPSHALSTCWPAWAQSSSMVAVWGAVDADAMRVRALPALTYTHREREASV